MSHLDDAQLNAYLSAKAEFADYATRRKAGRHIADCAECSERLKDAWAGHPESIDHPEGPPGRPSWPVPRQTRPIARPAVTPRDGLPDRPSVAAGNAGPARAVRPSAPPTATADPEDDPLEGTPWPGLISALEAILRPAKPALETPTPRAETADADPELEAAAGAAVASLAPDESDREPELAGPPELIAPGDPRRQEIELADVDSPPTLDLDLVERYDREARKRRRKNRRFQVFATAATLLVAVGLAGAVLRLGAKAPLVGETFAPRSPWANGVHDTAPTTILESAVIPLVSSDSSETGQDSTDSSATGVDSVPQSATNAPASSARTPAPSGGDEPAKASTPAPPPKPRPTPRRRSSSDTGLTSGYWAETTTAHAERLLGHRLVLISGLSVESVAKPTTTSGAFIRVAQVTSSGKRVALVLSRAVASGSSTPAPGLSSIQVVPPSETNPTAMGAASWGPLRITVRADLPTDELRALLTRLEARR